MGHLKRTQFALELIVSHLESTNSKESPTATYLVQYLLVSLYSEMEETVSDIIKNRLHFSGDKKLQSFVFNTNEAMIRRVKKAEIIDVLKKFGCEADELLEHVDESDIGYYTSAINNRHNVAHKQGSATSLRDFEKALEAANKIVSSLERCLT